MRACETEMRSSETEMRSSPPAAAPRAAAGVRANCRGAWRARSGRACRLWRRHMLWRVATSPMAAKSVKRSRVGHLEGYGTQQSNSSGAFTCTSGPQHIHPNSEWIDQVPANNLSFANCINTLRMLVLFWCRIAIEARLDDSSRAPRSRVLSADPLRPPLASVLLAVMITELAVLALAASSPWAHRWWYGSVLLFFLVFSWVCCGCCLMLCPLSSRPFPFSFFFHAWSRCRLDGQLTRLSSMPSHSSCCILWCSLLTQGGPM